MDRSDAETAAEALEVIANPLRVHILTALWELDRRGPVSYSTLQDAVGVRDSGRFNYHLSQLTDRYLRKTPDGYELRGIGLYVVDMLAAGVFGDIPEVSPIETGQDCPACGSELVARYEDAEQVVDCPDCGTVVSWLLFPPAGVAERLDDPAALVTAFGRRSRRLYAMAGDGLCPFCGREMTVTLERVEGEPIPCMIHKRCDGCGGRVRSSVGSHVHDHPAVVSFLWDHGERLDDEPLWTVDFVLGRGCSLDSASPLAARQVVERDGERLELVVDETGTVTETRRVRAADG